MRACVFMSVYVRVCLHTSLRTFGVVSVGRRVCLWVCVSVGVSVPQSVRVGGRACACWPVSVSESVGVFEFASVLV